MTVSLSRPIFFYKGSIKSHPIVPTFLPNPNPYDLVFRIIMGQILKLNSTLLHE